MVNIDVFKKETEQFLQEITKCKVDILILQRQIENDDLYKKNNEEIKRLKDIIDSTEKELEVNLKESGEKKIDTPAGWCSYRVMPDKWEYDIPKLIKWAKEDEERQEKYVKVVEEFRKAEFKTALKVGNLDYGLVMDEGLTITPQDPKFSYKLNGGI